MFVELCKSCEKQYPRDFKVCTKKFKGHLTGRNCTCGEPLCDSIIQFNEVSTRFDSEASSNYVLNTAAAVY